MAIKRRSGSSKNPPILSHEFIIQNHADLVSCIAMVFVVGLLFQATSPISSMFVVMSHNVSISDADTQTPPQPFIQYTTGWKDVPLVFFYSLICIVIHAVIQEYLLDKLNRRLHLSKIKHSKFNESGQLLVFYLVSVIWAGEIIRRDSLFISISQLWLGYPHVHLTYLVKFFMIVQLSYWIHAFPELYFQKVKKEELAGRISYSLLYLILWTVAYVGNLSRIAVCLSILHYTVEALFHASRLFYFAEKNSISTVGFKLWNVLFVLARLGSITLSVLTFWYGLPQSAAATTDLPSVPVNLNTPIIRMNLLLCVCLLQAWTMWNFINFHLRRLREQAAEKARQQKKTAPPKKKQIDSDGEGDVKLTHRTSKLNGGKH